MRTSQRWMNPPFQSRIHNAWKRLSQTINLPSLWKYSKNLHINIPFVDALEKMPSYVKFMKVILSKKRRLSDYETVALTKECSTIIQRKLPHKLKDLGNFTILCKIRNANFERALCELGASINLMPL